MPLPAWASHNHPIVRRDLAQWRQHRRNLGWLWLLFILPPLIGPVLLLIYLSWTYAKAFERP